MNKSDINDKSFNRSKNTVQWEMEEGLINYLTLSMNCPNMDSNIRVDLKNA